MKKVCRVEEHNGVLCFGRFDSANTTSLGRCYLFSLVLVIILYSLTGWGCKLGR